MLTTWCCWAVCGWLMKTVEGFCGKSLTTGFEVQWKKSEFMFFKEKKGAIKYAPHSAKRIFFKTCWSSQTPRSYCDCGFNWWLGHGERTQGVVDSRRVLAHRFARYSMEVNLTLFPAYCPSFYTNGLCINFNQRSFKSLRVQYNNILRALLRLLRFQIASGMFADVNVDDFYATLRKKNCVSDTSCTGKLQRYLQNDSPSFRLGHS